MKNTKYWIIAMLIVIVGALAFGYSVLVTTYKIPAPLPEQRIVHDYSEGYADGYKVGKKDALDYFLPF